MNNDQLYYHCRNIHYSHSHSCSSAFYFIFFRWYCCCYVLSSSTLYSRRDLFLLTQYYFWAQHRTRTKKYVTNPESTRPISIKKRKKKHLILLSLWIIVLSIEWRVRCIFVYSAAAAVLMVMWCICDYIVPCRCQSDSFEWAFGREWSAQQLLQTHSGRWLTHDAICN